VLNFYRHLHFILFVMFTSSRVLVHLIFYRAVINVIRFCENCSSLHIMMTHRHLCNVKLTNLWIPRVWNLRAHHSGITTLQNIVTDTFGPFDVGQRSFV